MRILAIGTMLHKAAIQAAAQEEKIELFCLTAAQAAVGYDLRGETFSAVLIGTDHGGHETLSNSPLLKSAPIVVPMSGETIVGGAATVSEDAVQTINAYFAYGGRENLRNGFRFIRRLAGETCGEILPPVALPFDSIYTPEGRLYDSAEAFFRGEGRKFSTYVGILCYRGRWTEEDTAVEEAIAAALARHGIGSILAYMDGSEDRELGILSFEEVLNRFFCRNGSRAVEALVTFHFFAARAGEGQDMFSRSADLFAAMDIPVVRPAGLGQKTEAAWQTELRPYTQELSTAFLMPELYGMIEPVHVYCTDAQQRRIPIPDRVERLAARISHWVELRTKPNREKRVALFLHNAPCAGVEATVGLATDLDAFSSTVAILQRLRREGYQVENIPESGQELKELIFQRKAYSDFRWTAAEDIAASGGVLHAMDLAEYLEHYHLLSAEARQKMEKSWGEPPGEAMVLENRLLITGISFGNVVVMVQPKRGCYGAKCTGEVCKILQDPACPPTHQFLATYWYLQHIWQANAVIHLGTHGSLEYLPGKDCGLSADCFSDIAIGDLVNLYPYQVGTVAQALIAKRRSYAATLSYLPAPGKGLTPEQRKLAETIRRYFSAVEQDSGQAELLRQEIEKAAEGSQAVCAVFQREPDFDAACREIRALLGKTDGRRRGGSMRTFGAAPDRQWIRDYMIELWDGDAPAELPWDVPDDPVERMNVLCQWIDAALDAPDTITDRALLPFREDARATAAALESAGAEMDALIHALSGGFIRPTRGGDAASGGRDILPTGRNIHAGEQDRVPTAAAWERGKQAATDLLTLYQQEEGHLPEKVAMNMTSMDITRTGGEQLGQFLYLLGIRPCWSAAGRVLKLEPISLEELKRPRIDVTVHISSVMRDAWPDIIRLMDSAVQLADAQQEPDDWNYVRRNSRAIAQRADHAAGRIFGGQPGTYTSAVGLALKASAWKDESDLAKYFIDGASYLYGEGKNGVRAVDTFAANIRQVDLTSDVTSSRRTDAVASSYSARVQGGFALAAKALGSSRRIRQYMGESGSGKTVRVVPMADHVAHAIEDTLLNDVWREQVMDDGYQGAADLMGRMQNIFDIQCMCSNIPAATIDAVVQQYLLDETMVRWFQQNNAFALEESGRRFLELHSRGKWDADDKILRQLQRAYLAAEGDLEDGLTGLGEIQGGSVDIIAHDQIDGWRERLAETEERLKQWNR